MKGTIENSSVLITGGAGFIGSNLTERLLSQNNKVVVLDNLSNGHKENIEEFLDNPDFRFIEGDIRDYDTCKQAVEGCEYVLHQAALGSVPRSIKDPKTSTNVNVGGFVNMLFAAVEAGIKRFVYASSSSVYGDSKELPKVEERIGKPLSPYAITKLSNEIYAKNFSEIYGIETIGLRYFNVFGPKQDPNGAYAAVIPKWSLMLKNCEAPVINGDTGISRDFTYIENVLQANQRAATTPTEFIRENQKKYYDNNVPSGDVVSEMFNIACGGRTTLIELFEYLKKNFAEKNSEVAAVNAVIGEKRKGDIPHSHANITKAAMLLGYSPEILVEEGIKLVSEYYMNK